MPHPSTRTNRRPRKRRTDFPRFTITAKGRAMLAAYDAFRGAALANERAHEQSDHDQGRATPCAPNRGETAPAPLPAQNAGTAGAPPAHPAGKSGAADRANDQEPTP